MKVYSPHESAKSQARHTLHICPAAHLKGQEVPADWVDDDNKPKQFQVTFAYGETDVPSEIGKYLVAHGMAKKTSLILPRGLTA